MPRLHLRLILLFSSNVLLACAEEGEDTPWHSEPGVEELPAVPTTFPAPMLPPFPGFEPENREARDAFVNADDAGTDAAAEAGASLPYQPSVSASVDPCVDFASYACEPWLAKAKIPEGRPRWAVPGDIWLHNVSLLRDIFEKYARGERSNEPYARELGDFYTACMNKAAIEREGVTGLEPLFAIIDGLTKTEDVLKVLGQLYRAGRPVLLPVFVATDPSDGTRIAAHIGQGGTVLPVEWYSAPEQSMLRTQYGQEIAQLLLAAGRNPLAALAILDMETALARASFRPQDARDVTKTTHSMAREQLAALAPNLSVLDFVQAIGIPEGGRFNVHQPAFVQAIAELARSRSVEDWKSFLSWQVLVTSRVYLPRKFLDTPLLGSPERPDRWASCVGETQSQLGILTQRPFVEAAFDPASKAQLTELVQGVQRAMESTLSSATWLDASTRMAALAKLGKLVSFSGYPDVWPTWPDLKVGRDSFLGNTLAITASAMRMAYASVGKPNDRNAWPKMQPADELNAFNMPSNVALILAGFMQPPLFGKTQPIALNYGAAGSIIGHEITHSFDDQGRRFDGEGTLRDWWSAATATELERRSRCLVQQYSAYLAEPEAKEADAVHVNGELTLGENIADLQGVKLAFAAFKEKLSQQPLPPSMFSPEQQFFLGYAHSYCDLYKPGYWAQASLFDPHAPNRHRTNGVLSNVPAFAQAFSCAEGSPMARKKEQRCELW